MGTKVFIRTDGDCNLVIFWKTGFSVKLNNVLQKDICCSLDFESTVLAKYFESLINFSPNKLDVCAPIDSRNDSEEKRGDPEQKASM